MYILVFWMVSSLVPYHGVPSVAIGFPDSASCERFAKSVEVTINDSSIHHACLPKYPE